MEVEKGASGLMDSPGFYKEPAGENEHTAGNMSDLSSDGFKMNSLVGKCNNPPCDKNSCYDSFIWICVGGARVDSEATISSSLVVAEV
uniref:Uncharacterized protein n=1 Tax=Xenopus tropicalis TaxID=8364 RepID=A0A1B8YA79_XENTR